MWLDSQLQLQLYSQLICIPMSQPHAYMHVYGYSYHIQPSYDTTDDVYICMLFVITSQLIIITLKLIFLNPYSNTYSGISAIMHVLILCSQSYVKFCRERLWLYTQDLITLVEQLSSYLPIYMAYRAHAQKLICT